MRSLQCSTSIVHPASVLMSRRHCLQTLLRAAGVCFVPFSKLFSQSPSSNGIGNYLPHFEDISEKARLLYKTTLIGHESKDFHLSTTGGGVALFDYDND